MASRLIRVTATGAAYTGKCFLKSLALQGGSANSTAVVDDSTDGSGTDLASLAALANSGASWVSGDSDGVPFGTAIYVTLSGTGAALTLEIEA